MTVVDGVRSAGVVAVLAVVTACSSAPIGSSAPATPASTDAPPSTPTSTSEPPVAPSATPSPSPTHTSWGPSLADAAAAQRLVAAMSVEAQAGQVIVARITGTAPDVGADLVRTYGLGGVILFAENVVSPEQVAALTTGLQQAVASAGRTFPLVVGVDQEGGTVARLAAGVTEMPAYMSLGAARDPELAEAVALASGEELRALGVTMVFGPDADVTSGPDDPTIGTRSASSDPRLVAEIVTASVRGYVGAGVVPVVKHFPGHGSVPADSHEVLPVQEASLAELQGRDLVPFRAAVGAGVPAVMVGHIDVRDVDPGVPSSLSAPALAVLRDDLGFDGLAVTDALEMDPVVQQFGTAEAAVRALAAGGDMLLMPLDVGVARDAIVAATQAGTLPGQRLADAAAAVVATALWQQRIGAAPLGLDTLESTAHHAASYAASLGGLTVVEGACEGALVSGEVQVVGGTEADRVRFAAAAAGDLTVGATGAVVRLLGDARAGAGDVVVALDRPYGLGLSDATIAKIALYGRTPDAFAALVDVLVGRERGTGQLPVAVEGAERTGCP